MLDRLGVLNSPDVDLFGGLLLSRRRLCPGTRRRGGRAAVRSRRLRRPRRSCPGSQHASAPHAAQPDDGLLEPFGSLEAARCCLVVDEIGINQLRRRSSSPSTACVPRRRLSPCSNPASRSRTQLHAGKDPYSPGVDHGQTPPQVLDQLELADRAYVARFSQSPTEPRWLDCCSGIPSAQSGTLRLGIRTR